MKVDTRRETPHLRSLQCTGALCLALLSAPLAQAGQEQWFLHAGGLSRHSHETQAIGRSWQEQHAGLGLERRGQAWGINRAEWTMSTSGGVMQDSRGYWSGYAGTAYTRQWTHGRSVETSLGLGAYLFYRSTNWKGDMALMPALMPVSTVHLLNLGLSLNLAYVPRVTALNSAMPSVLYLQLGFRLP